MKIEIQNLSFIRKKDFAIDDLSLQIEAGKITTLIGPNGSGKSTLLRLMMRLLAPNEGTILLEGTELSALSSKKARTRNDDAFASARWSFGCGCS